MPKYLIRLMIENTFSVEEENLGQVPLRANEILHDYYMKGIPCYVYSIEEVKEGGDNSDAD